MGGFLSLQCIFSCCNNDICIRFIEFYNHKLVLHRGCIYNARQAEDMQVISNISIYFSYVLASSCTVSILCYLCIGIIISWNLFMRAADCCILFYNSMVKSIEWEHVYISRNLKCERLDKSYRYRP